jgi:hypothetical protein
MSTPQFPGLDVSTRVRARDIQLAAVAHVGHRVLMISGAVDTTDHDVSVALTLPAPGRWQVIKAETNLTDQTWVAMQVVTDENSTIVTDDDTPLLSRQFAKVFVTPDQRRATFYDGEVRPGEALVKMYTLEAGGTEPTYTYSQYSPISSDTPEQSARTLEQIVADSMRPRPVVELVIPLTIVG